MGWFQTLQRGLLVRRFPSEPVLVGPFSSVELSVQKMLICVRSLSNALRFRGSRQRGDNADDKCGSILRGLLH
jgi:hypothetical protein